MSTLHCCKIGREKSGLAWRKLYYECWKVLIVTFDRKLRRKIMKNGWNKFIARKKEREWKYKLRKMKKKKTRDGKYLSFFPCYMLWGRGKVSRKILRVPPLKSLRNERVVLHGVQRERQRERRSREMGRERDCVPHGPLKTWWICRLLNNITEDIPLLQTKNSLKIIEAKRTDGLCFHSIKYFKF